MRSFFQSHLWTQRVCVGYLNRYFFIHIYNHMFLIVITHSSSLFRWRWISNRSRPAAAIQPAEYAALMDKHGITRSDTLAIAVSGGADSMALCLLTHEWSQQQVKREVPGRLLAIIIDHGLREESAIEASRVAQWLDDRGIEYILHKLDWSQGSPKANVLQDEARKSRRNVLLNHCVQRDSTWLLMGHHLGDQLETQLNRLARGTGPFGTASTPSYSLNMIYEIHTFLFLLARSSRDGRSGAITTLWS